jgi:hypothetical protein
MVEIKVSGNNCFLVFTEIYVEILKKCILVNKARLDLHRIVRRKSDTFKKDFPMLYTLKPSLMFSPFTKIFSEVKKVAACFAHFSSYAA